MWSRIYPVCPSSLAERFKYESKKNKKENLMYFIMPLQNHEKTSFLKDKEKQL
jgi:hypothetical protein